MAATQRYRRAALVMALSLVLGACVAAAEGNDRSDTTRRPRITTTTGAPFPDASVADLADPVAPGLGNGGYDVDHYALQLAFRPEMALIQATATVDAVAIAAIDEVSFDFAGGAVTWVHVDGAPTEFRREPNELIVILPEAKDPGDRFTAEVRYSGTPSSDRSRLARHDVGWMRDDRGTWHVIADPDGAHLWFPANDHPSDKATFQLDFEVPADMTAASSGTFAALGDASETVAARWTIDHPVSPHRVVAMMGDLELVVDDVAPGGVEIRHLLPADMVSRPPAALGTVDRMVQFLEERFGRYPYDAFGVAVVESATAGNGGHTWATLTREELEADDAELKIVNHLASQWFGDSVAPATWSDVWLWTSFGRYAEWLWIEAALGEQAADLVASNARRVVERSPWPPPDEPPPGDLYVGSVFLHGAITLHAVRLRMGDGPFYEMVAGFHAAHAGSTASTADFVAALSDAGGRSIRHLFETWFDASEMPGFPSR